MKFSTIDRIKNTSRAVATRGTTFLKAAWAAVTLGLIEVFTSKRGRQLLAVLTLAGVGALCVFRPPVATVEPGMAGVRTNRLTGGTTIMARGPVLVLPFIHQLRAISLREQIYRPAQVSLANGGRTFQSVEGLSLGVEVTVRYAVAPDQVARIAQTLPSDLGHDLIEPTVDGVVHRVLSQHTVREIFTDQRAQIEKTITDELTTRLAADGVKLRGVFLGKVDLPADYLQGLEGLLTEELASEKMRYTLALREKQVQETRLQGEAAKAQRETAAEAQALEQVIAAKGRAEAMQHVLPLKEKEIEQHRLEAQAQKVQRHLAAEAEADARVVEADGEARARRQLADADAYRIEVTGKANSEQLARDSELIAKNPLMIQKTMADKLSERVQVIIAPPSQGGFIAGNLIGTGDGHNAAK